MTKVSLSSFQLVSLIKQSKTIGTQDKAIDLAIEWVEGAEIMISELREMLDGLVAYLESVPEQTIVPDGRVKDAREKIGRS